MKLLFLILPLIAGCSYKYEFGQIGAHRLYKIQLGSIAGSTQTMFGILDTNTGTLTYTTPIGGNGVIGAVGSGTGQAAAGWFVGQGLEKGNFSSSVNQSGSASAAGGAASSSSEAVSHSSPVIHDPPTAPPITRTRPPYGRWWR